MRLTEEQVMNRLAAAVDGAFRSESEREALWRSLEQMRRGEPAGPRAMRAIGVRWTGGHYEEEGE